MPPACAGRSHAGTRVAKGVNPFRPARIRPISYSSSGVTACAHAPTIQVPQKLTFVRGVRSAGVSLKIGWYFLYPLYEARQQGREKVCLQHACSIL